MKHYLSHLDRTLTARLYMRPAKLDQIFAWITLLGHPVTIVFIIVLVTIAALGMQKHSIAAAFAASLIALALGSSLKFVLRRARPATPYAARMKQRTFSFPSGHSYGAALLYGLILCLALPSFTSPWGGVMALVLLPLIFLIGFSRIYLGAHYLLDVIGGWLLAIPVVWILIAYFAS